MTISLASSRSYVSSGHEVDVRFRPPPIADPQQERGDYTMEWLEPWYAVSTGAAGVASTLERQLAIEVPPGHILFGVQVKLIARGNGDDAMFELMEGSGRVAGVHLAWSKSTERLPFPGAAVYGSLEEWASQVM